MIIHSLVLYSSLIPRLNREPGINCLCMHVISPRSGENRILTAFYSFMGTSQFSVTSSGYDGWWFRAQSWGIGVCPSAQRKFNRVRRSLIKKSREPYKAMRAYHRSRTSSFYVSRLFPVLFCIYWQCFCSMYAYSCCWAAVLWQPWQ